MAADFQVLAFQDSAPLRQVGLFSSSPLTLDIRGSSFVGVARVLINGVDAPEYVVLSRTRILAQVPDREKTAVLRNVRVLLARTGLSDTSAILFDAVVPGARAEGFTKLMQSFLRLLFTNPGDDLASPWAGGGMYQLVGRAGTGSELRALAARAVSTTEQHMIRLQTRNAVLTDAERLRSATLLQADYDQPTTSLQVRLRLTAVDGSTGAPLLSV